MVRRGAWLLSILLVCPWVAVGQTSATVDCGYTVKVGEPALKVHVALNDAPSIDGVYLRVYLLGPDNAALGGVIRMKPGTKEYDVSVDVPSSTVGGVWAVDSVRVDVAGRASQFLPFNKCTFEIIAAPEIVLPTRAEVGINPSQSQLLRREATRVQTRIQEMKSKVYEIDIASRKGVVTPLLRRALADSMSALQATQEEFLKLATSKEQRPNAEVFFGDLAKSYKGAISRLGSLAEAMRGEHLMRVADGNKTVEPLLDLALRPMEQNELAYTLVADQGSLVFDLEVDSSPDGAAVSYYRRGDQPRANPDPTRSTIHSLPYAIWIVHFEKSGYRPEDREHDPFRERNHVVHVNLQK